MRALPDCPAPAIHQRPRQGMLSSTHWCATEPHNTASGTLSQSFLADLRRFDEHPMGCGLLPAMAASVRHDLAAALHLWSDEGQAITLKVYPRERWVQCNIDLTALSEQALTQLRFSHAERLLPLREALPICSTDSCGPLGPLLWQLATQGPTQDLLPEIAGTAMYRLAPAPHLDALPTTPVMDRLLSWLRGPPASAEKLADAAGCEARQVHRLLNALYLQSALMVTRSFPAAWNGSGTGANPHSKP